MALFSVPVKRAVVNWVREEGVVFAFEVRPRLSSLSSLSP